MIIFRADGNSNIGLGHIMRCLSIADTYRKQGEKCTFVAADNSARQAIEEHGFSLMSLDSDYHSLNNELDKFISYISKESVTTIIIDSYYVTQEYMNRLWQYCNNNSITLAYIDDYCTFPYSCHVLINYNIYANEDSYKELYKDHHAPLFFLGTKYAPLREEFRGETNQSIKKDTESNNILIMTGGADPKHLCIEFIKSIKNHLDWNIYSFQIVVGAVNPDKSKIEELSEGVENITIHSNVKQMASLMRSSDIAISAAGSTLYELCATQTPAITYILADNQIKAAQEFDRLNVITNAGSIQSMDSETLVNKVLIDAIDLMNDQDKREKVIISMKDIVDTKGTERIVNKLMDNTYNDSETGKCAFIAYTPFHLLNILSYVLTHKIDNADLYVVHNFNSYEGIEERIKETSIFDNVYYANDNLREKIWKAVGLLAPNLMCEHIFNVKNIKAKNYSQLYFSIPTRLIDIVINIFKNAEIIAFDDGIASYADTDSTEQIDGRFSFVIKLFGIKKRVPERLLLNNPKYYISKKNRVIEPIRTRDLNSDETAAINKVFDIESSDFYCKRPCIYLNEEHSFFTNKESYLKTERELLDMIPKDKLTVRLHPKETDLDFYKKYVLDNNKMWELQCMNNISDENVLISWYSTAQFTPKMIYDKEPTVIFTYKFFPDEPVSDEMIDLVNKLRSNYSNPEKVIVLNEINELNSYLS